MLEAKIVGMSAFLVSCVLTGWILDHFSRLANYQCFQNVHHMWLKGRNGNYNFHFLGDTFLFFMYLNYILSPPQPLPEPPNFPKTKQNKTSQPKWQQNKIAHKNHRAMESVSQLLLSMGPALKEQDTHVWNQRLTACIRPVQAHTRQIPGQRREANTVPNHPPKKRFAVDTCWRGKLPSRGLMVHFHLVCGESVPVATLSA